ncbi:MAG: hypothetical protein ABI543_06075 [Ignavibacteria bacterium]
MAADKQIIINTLNWVKSEGSAAVFTIGDQYVQTASILPAEMYCEAVSHHYHSLIDIHLESSFIKMGFSLAEGGNYNRKYYTGDEFSIEKFAEDIMKIFGEIYRSDINLPFEVTEL